MHAIDNTAWRRSAACVRVFNIDDLKIHDQWNLKELKAGCRPWTNLCCHEMMTYFTGPGMSIALRRQNFLYEDWKCYVKCSARIKLSIFSISLGTSTPCAVWSTLIICSQELVSSSTTGDNAELLGGFIIFCGQLLPNSLLKTAKQRERGLKIKALKNHESLQIRVWHTFILWPFSRTFNCSRSSSSWRGVAAIFGYTARNLAS